MLIRLFLLLAVIFSLVVHPVLAWQEETADSVDSGPGVETPLPADGAVPDDDTGSDGPPPMISPPATTPPVPTTGRLFDPQPLGPVEIRGWSFIHIEHEGQDVYYQPTTKPERLQRALLGIGRAQSEAPKALGVPDIHVDYFLFPRRSDLVRALSKLAGVPIGYITTSEDAVAFTNPVQPVTFLHGAAFDQEARGTWVVAHELTHHLQARLANNANYPIWFNEGIAEYVGSQVARQFYPDYYGLLSFAITGVMANAGRQGALPSLVPLQTDRQWVTANRADRYGILYPKSWLTVDWLVSQRDASVLSRTLTQVGERRPFLDAFSDVMSLPLGELDLAFQNYVNETLAARYPPGVTLFRSSAPIDGRIIFVLSLQPREQARIQFQNGACRGIRTVKADAMGFVLSSFTQSAARCTGNYTATMTGSMGTSGSAQFTLTAAAA
jgi:hypothetical protein